MKSNEPKSNEIPAMITGWTQPDRDGMELRRLYNNQSQWHWKTAVFCNTTTKTAIQGAICGACSTSYFGYVAWQHGVRAAIFN
jgi:hypothetical protein